MQSKSNNITKSSHSAVFIFEIVIEGAREWGQGWLTKPTLMQTHFLILKVLLPTFYEESKSLSATIKRPLLLGSLSLFPPSTSLDHVLDQKNAVPEKPSL
jgi:hypothetical protein